MREDPWPEGIEEAKAIQHLLNEKIKITPLKNAPEFVAAADAAFSENRVFAVASLYKFLLFESAPMHPRANLVVDSESLVHMQDAFSEARATFHYMPGLLAFREGKAVIEAIRKLEISPGVLLIDGQGIAHPEGVGIASHIGVLLNIPTVGCAKTRLVGEYQEPGPEKGDWSYLYYRGMEVGAVLRTRAHVRPVFVSPGHLVDIESAVRIVMMCVTGFRIPEPLRMADRLSRKMKRDCSECF